MKVEAGYTVNSNIKKDINTLSRFIEIYCDINHEQIEKKEVSASGRVGIYLNDLNIMLCGSCRKLLLHSAGKRLICPYDPKPSCKKCKTHCYGKGYRDNIQEVMRFSGKYLIKSGKIGAIMKYYF